MGQKRDVRQIRAIALEFDMGTPRSDANSATISKTVSSTFADYLGFAEVGILGAMEGRDRLSHRTQGGHHGYCNTATA